MCALHLTRADGVPKLLEMIVVDCVLEPGQITDELTKAVIGFGSIPSHKILKNLLDIP